MRKIERSDILPTESYLTQRDQFKEKIFRIKENRRVQVGGYLTFLFENRETMIYQVQEMMRAEGIREDAAIAHEIETYNQLVPESNELRATLLIEIVDPVVRAVKLKELVGLEKQVFLLIDRDFQVQAVFDDKQIDPEKLSSVQYIYFPLGEKATEAFLSTDHVEILTAHPACSYRQPLTASQLSSLKEDLRAT